MEVDHLIKKQCEELFNGEAYFEWNPFKKMFQAVAFDAGTKDKYVIFYVCDEKNNNRAIIPADVQRIQDARTFRENEREARNKERKKSYLADRSEHVRKHHEAKKRSSSRLDVIAYDLSHNEAAARALHRDMSRGVRVNFK